MNASTPVDQTSPLWLAWQAYTATDEYANTERWAVYPEHAKGSLWAAFERGFAANRNGSSTLSAQGDAARDSARLDDIEWFGCMTGDCPHATQVECDVAILGVVRSVIAERRSAHALAREHQGFSVHLNS